MKQIQLACHLLFSNQSITKLTKCKILYQNFHVMLVQKDVPMGTCGPFFISGLRSESDGGKQQQQQTAEGLNVTQELK